MLVRLRLCNFDLDTDLTAFHKQSKQKFQSAAEVSWCSSEIQTGVFMTL